jgi:hypothetical protein
MNGAPSIGVVIALAVLVIAVLAFLVKLFVDKPNRAEKWERATASVRNHYRILLDADVVREADGAAARIPVNEHPSAGNHRTFRILGSMTSSRIT